MCPQIQRDGTTALAFYHVILDCVCISINTLFTQADYHMYNDLVTVGAGEVG